jgi:hypothetical protein
MARQEIDIGIQGNDGTGDSIRDSFRKVNENFNEIYAIFGAGGTIKFTALGDAPSSYTNNQIFITNDAGTAILAKTLTATGGVSIDNSRAGELRLVGTQSNLYADGAPRLGGPFNANNLAIGNIPDPSPALVSAFNATFSSLGISTTIDKLAISKGYADSHYVSKGTGNVVAGALRVRDEPLVADLTDSTYDATLTSNYLSNEVLPRKNTVYRGGDTMLGKLTLSDHPSPVAGFGTPNSADDKQAATKFYVDNEVFVSSVNLYVRTDGDDTQLKTPAGREGRNWAHAYKTVGAAALQAETLQSLASLEPGPYRQKISYTISPNQFNSTIQSIALSGGNSATQGYVDAAALLTANKTFIQAETIAYINSKYVNSFTYDQQRYQTDIVAILDAVGTDLVIGSNYNSLQYATSYFLSRNSTIISNQLIQLIDAIGYARNQVLAFSYDGTALNTYLNLVVDALNIDMVFNSNYQSILMARYFSYANTGLSVTEIIGALQQLQIALTNGSSLLGNPVDAAVNSFTNNISTMIVVIQGGIEPALSMTPLVSTTTSQVSARTLLISNISFIQAEIVAWLGANYPKLAYSQSTCKRDVKYIVEAIAYDQQYGGNSKTIYAGQRYWANYARQIASSELNATKGAIAYINTLAQAIISNSTPAQVYQNSVSQYQNQTYSGGSAQSSKISNLVSLISGTSFSVLATNATGSALTTTSTVNMTVGMPITFDLTSTITVTGFQSKTGTGPYLVSVVVPTQTVLPVVGSSFTVSGNSNTSYNGTFTVSSRTATSIVLNYPSDPGTYGSGTTILTPYLGGITAGNTYYIIEITDTTHFKISTQLNGVSVSLTSATMNVSATYAGLLSANIAPAITSPNYALGAATLVTIYGNINTNKSTTINSIVLFVNNSYPYINNSSAITGITSLFQVIIDTLTKSLTYRSLLSLNAPSTLASGPKNAAIMLVKNTAFISQEVAGWLKQNYPSFAYVDSNGQDQWIRDIRSLVEAVAYDVTYGSTSGSTTAANLFWTSAVINDVITYTSTIDASEKSTKIAALGYAQQLSAAVAGNNTPASLYQQYLPKTITYVSKSGTGPYLVTLNIPKTIIPMDPGTSVAISGNTTVGFNATVSVVSCTDTTMVVSYPSDPGTWSITTTTTYTVVQTIDTNYPGGSSASTTVNDKWDRIINVIDLNPPSLVVTKPDLSISPYALSGFVGVRTTMVVNSYAVAQATTAYLNIKYKGGFNYNEATCRRDVGYIVDAMSIDLLTGGTYQSINAGKSYYKNSSAKAIAIGTQNIETIDGIKYAQALGLQVLNQTTASRYQTLVSQTIDGTKNANSGYSATATYSSGTGTQIVVSGISGTILPGMTLTGAGFLGGRTVTAVNGTTITISSAPAGTPSGTLTFILTAITTFTSNYAVMLSIVQNGIGVAPTPSFGSGIYTVTFSNGGNGYVDQCPPGDYNILPGKILRGVGSNATANILSYSPGASSNADTITCQLLQPGFFVQNEELEFAESVGALQIVIFVEAGVYYEDYPIRMTSNVSIKGDEFRRTIIRPLDRISQSPWRKLFFYRDSVIDGMQIGPIDTSYDYTPTTNITSFVSKTLVSGTTYDILFNIPTQTYIPSTTITYTIAGNTNLSYNGAFACTASTSSSITLRYLSDPGTFNTNSITTIGPLVSATISGTVGKIIITLSSNMQASVAWLGYVFQSDVLDANGKPGLAVVDSVSGNFMNCTVMYPFSQTGTMTINYTNGYTFQVGETITQTGITSSATGSILSVSSNSITYKVTSGVMSTLSGAITGSTSGATASVSAIQFGVLAPTTWHLYTTSNYGRHYLTNPLDVNSTPLNNRDIDLFLCGNAVRVNNLTMEGHGGFAMVLDPEGQIKSKSPYGQVATSFSRSQNKQVFAGGQFVDGFTGRLLGTITYASADGFTLIVTGGVNSGLDVRAPQTPTAFFVKGGRYQVNTVSNYTQTFDINGNVIGGSVQLNLGAQTPWLQGTGQAINIEMAGNKSMLANDFAMINDLGYAILATNGGITEQVSTFTYYCWTAFWALNGGQIRSVGSSSAHGTYALRASGYDVTEKPDSVSLAQNLAQVARIFNPTSLPQSSTNNQFYGNMNTGGISVYIYGYDYFPTQISELEIDHTLAGKGLVRYQINSISHTTVYVPTGSVGTNYKYVSTTYTAAGSSGTTLVVASTAGVVIGMTVTGVGFTRGQQVTAVSLDGITLTLNGAPDSTPTNSQALTIGDTVTVSGGNLGGVSSKFTGNTTTDQNFIASASTLVAVRPSPAVLVQGYISKTGTGPYLVTFQIPTQVSAPSATTGYVIDGNSNSNYNGTFSATTGTYTSITISYPSDPGVYSSTNYTTIMFPSATAATFDTKVGSAPNIYITYLISAVSTAPLVGGLYTIAGNTNTSYNGTFVCTASTLTSLTLRYTTDPGSSGGSATTYNFNGSVITGPNIPFNTTALATTGGNTVILSKNATATAAGSTFSSNAGSDLVAYVTGVTNTGLSTFTYTGIPTAGGSGVYSNTYATSSSGIGVYATFNITASTTFSSGTVGSISGSGPWTATITGMTSTTGLAVGTTLSATAGTGTLYGGSPTTVYVTSIVSGTSITYKVIGGTTPTAGTVTAIQSTSAYTSATIGGQNVLLCTLSTSGTGGTSSTGLAAPLYDGQLIQLRVLQNFKFYEIDNVNPTRPSTAVQFTDNLGSIYRVLTYNLTEATNEVLPSNQAVLSTDQSFQYYLFQADTANITKTDPIDSSKTMGSTPGDIRIAVNVFGPQANIDQVNKGTYAFAFGGKVHSIASYTPPVTTTIFTGYNPTGSSGTTVVVGGNFTGTITSGSATITNVSSFTGIVVGELIIGKGIPAGTTIISTNNGASSLGISSAASATGSGITFMYGSTAGLTVGMTIKGTGFSSAQTISSITPSSIASFVIADTVGTITVTSGTYVIGQSINISGTFGGTGSLIVGGTTYSAAGTSNMTAGVNFYVGKVNSGTSIQICSSYANAIATSPTFITSTAGTPTGLTYTLVSNTIILNTGPSSVPSGTLTFTKATVPYITLGANQYSITSINSSPITISRWSSRGQVAATFVTTGTITGNITSASTSILGVSSLTNIAAGTNISGANIPGNIVVTATSTTSPSTITLTDASGVAVGNAITFTGSGTTFGNIPQPGALTTSTTYTSITGTSTVSASTYTGVKAKIGSASGSGAIFSVTKTGSGTTWTGVTSITMTTPGQNYSVGQTVTLSGGDLGGTDGVNDLTFTIATEVGQNTFYIVSKATNAITISKTYSGSALTNITTSTGSITGRTDNFIQSTSSTATFTGNTAIGSNVITNVQLTAFNTLVVGAQLSGSGVGAGATVTSFNNTGVQSTSTITVTALGNGNNTGATITITSNTIVLGAAATGSATGQILYYNNLSTSIKVYTSDRTQYIVAGMTVIGNGFSNGQTVISATPSATGEPYTTVVLSAVPSSTPFGVLGFWTYSSISGPWYTTFEIPTQSTAPVVDTYYLMAGNSTTLYNKYVQVVASSTTSITLAYTIDPESAIVATYNSSGSTGTTLKVSGTTGISVGMLIRGVGFIADQKVTAVNIDGVTLTISSAPSSVPTGNLTFFTQYGSGATTITPSTTGISRPMSSTVTTPLRAGYQAGTAAQITTRISTCRCSAHDLLDIGTGGYNTTNYPYQIYGNPYQKADQTKEILEETVGRCFYVTTDQNGIFRVGRFFTVDQGTGTVTFSASIALSNLDGLGFKRGVTVSEFSTDSSMTNDASDTVPTQSAVRGYIDNRLGLQHSGASTPATALIGPGFMALSGQLPMKGNMSMGGFNIGSLGTPLLQNDATNKFYVDTTVNDTDSIYKVKDSAKRMGTSVINGQILVYGTSNTNNALGTGAWTNASFDPTSDVNISWDGSTLLSTIQGAVVTTAYISGGTSVIAGSLTGTIDGNVLTVTGAPTITIVPGMILTGGTVAANTYIVDYKTGIGVAGTYVINNFQASGTTVTGGSTVPLTLASTTGIVRGMVLSGTGFSSGQVVTGIVNTVIVNISAVGTSPSGTMTFTRDGSINDGKVSSTADIQQSKLLLTIATGRASAPTGTAKQKQAASGLASFDNNILTVTDGWVSLKTATSTSDGIAVAKMSWIAPNSVLANISGSNAAVSVTTTTAMVNNGDGIRNGDIPTSTSSTGAIVRTGVKAYDCIPISTSGGNDSIVKTTGAGLIDVKGIKIAGLPSSGNILQINSTTLEFYTPGNVKFMQSLGSSTATTTHYGLHDFSQTGASITVTSLTSGGNTTDGTLTGRWSLASGSSLNCSVGTFTTRSITTGREDLDCPMTGVYTLVGASKLQATYAGDLAEYYEGDAEYEVGTVLVFGGDKEVTVTSDMNDTRVAGVVSDNAAYSMYAACPGLKNLIALQGRVPVKVVGRIRKGDLLTTSSTPGHAVKATDPKLGSIIGKALEDKDNGEAGVIQVAVGRM